MLSFFVRKLASLLLTFLGITVLAFALIHMIPGDPVEVMAGDRRLDREAHQAAMHSLGLDKPLYTQYASYLGRLVHGDLGKSLFTNQPVAEEFKARFPATVELGACALLFAILLGLPAGMLAGLKRGSVLDHAVMAIGLTGYSMPIYWFGQVLVIYFSLHLGWAPVSGRIDIAYDIAPHTGFMLIDSLLAPDEGAFGSAVRSIILPTIALGTIPLAIIARMTRSSMLEVLREDYIRTARAKGLAPLRVVVVHALRNALIPVITVIGLQAGSLLAGAVLTETIFAWPGIGRWLVESVSRRDYPVVQAGILIIATMIITVNLLVDLMYGLVNPRGGAHG
jgi:dipeptide transport system permease protein